MPYEEIRHTADWSLRVWADDLESLLVEAAIGMNALAGITIAVSPIIEKDFQTDANDPESLIVKFLSELIYLAETENLAFTQFDIGVENGILHATMHGDQIQSISKSIKAVTFHNLKLSKTKDGVEAVIVFDV